MFSLGSVIISQLILQSLRSSQQLVLVYVLVRAWGAVSFGNWVVLMSAATFVSMSDLGVQTVLSNQCLTFSRDEDRSDLSKHVEGILGFYIVFVPVTLLILLVVSTSPAFSLLAAGATRSVADGTGNLVFLALSSSFVIAIPLNVMGSVYAARGEVARGIGRVSIQLVLQTLLILLAVGVQGSLLAVAFTYPLAALICFGWVFVDLSRRYPDLTMRPRLVDLNWLVRRLRLGFLYSVSPFAALLIQNIPVLFAGLVVASADIVAVYAVARILVGLLRQLAIQVANAVSVDIMRRFVRRDAEQSRELFVEANRFIAAMSGLLGGLMLAMAPAFIALWTQNKIGFDFPLMFTLVVTVCLGAPWYQPTALLQVGNKPRLLTIGAVLQALLGCALASGLSYFGGDFRVLVVALSAIELITNGIIAYKARKAFDVIDLSKLGASYAICGIGLIAAFTIGKSLNALFPQTDQFDVIMSNLLASVACIFLLFYLGVSKADRILFTERFVGVMSVKIRSRMR